MNINYNVGNKNLTLLKKRELMFQIFQNFCRKQHGRASLILLCVETKYIIITNTHILFKINNHFFIQYFLYDT